MSARMRLYWHDMAPIPSMPQLTVWGGITEEEAAALRVFGKANRVIEIGAAFGFSTLALASVARHVWSIDPHTARVVPGNFDLSQQYDIDRLQAGSLAILTANLETAGLTDKVTICQEYSQNYLERESPPANFAFIDGDHSEVGCLTDLRNCVRILGKGTICVHDYLCEEGVQAAVDSWGPHQEIIGSMAVIHF